MTTYIPSLTLPAAVFESATASVLLPLVFGNAVGFFTRPSDTKFSYNALTQPPFSPPAYVFAPVWTALYGAMGYAAHRAWTAGLSAVNPQRAIDARHGATLYTIQLGLNLIWMPLFFGLGKPIAATADIVTLTGTVGYLIYVWHKVDAVASWTLIPYLGWLGFATYLSAGVGHLNGWDFRGRQRASKSQ